MAKAVTGNLQAAARAVAAAAAGGAATARGALAVAILFVGLLGGLVDANSADVSVTDFGAVGDGQQLCTEAFRRALEHVSKAGGGILRVPPGVFFTGPLNLTSHLILWLESGARLLADTSRQRLPLLPALPSYGPANSPFDARKVQADLRDAIRRFQPLLHGVDLENVTITGNNGTLDGQGHDWWERWLAEPLDGRPHLVQFERSRGLRLENVTLVNPGFWSTHFWLCEYVIVRFVTVLVVPWNPPVRPTNTDGINPDSTSHVLIEDSYLQTGDDSVAVKSGWDCFGRHVGAPARNITVRRVTVRQTLGCNAAGIAIGSEMSGGVEDVLIEDCHFLHAGVAVEVKVGTGRGGFVRNVHARDLQVEHTSRAALVVMATYPEGNPFCQESSPPRPTVSDITYERVRVRGPTYGHLVRLEGTREVYLRNISVRDVHGSGIWSCKAVTGTSSGNSPAACTAIGGPRRKVGYEYDSRSGGGRQYQDYGDYWERSQHRRRRSYGPQEERQPALPPERPRTAVQAQGGLGWRNDGRCGEDWPAKEGLAGRCPLPSEFNRERSLPSRRFVEPFLRNAPCCSRAGWCGDATEHCSCIGCIDFRREGRPAAASSYRSSDNSRSNAYESQRGRVPPRTRSDDLGALPDRRSSHRPARVSGGQADRQRRPPVPSVQAAPCMWRQTGGCTRTGPREADKDQYCSAIISDRASGFCDCNGNNVLDEHEHGYECGSSPGMCDMVCETLPQPEMATHAVDEWPDAVDEWPDTPHINGGAYDEEEAQSAEFTSSETLFQQVLEKPASSFAALAGPPMEPPVQGLITSSMFALCAFLCGLLVRRYLPSSRSNHLLWICGLLAVFIFICLVMSLAHSTPAPVDVQSRPARSIRLGEQRSRPGQPPRGYSPPGSAYYDQPGYGGRGYGGDEPPRSEYYGGRPAPRSRQGRGRGAASHSPAQAVARLPTMALDVASQTSQTPENSSQADGSCWTKTVVTPLDFQGAGDGQVDDTDAVRSALVYGHRCRTKVVIGPAGYSFLVRPGALQVSLHNVTIRFEGELLGPTLYAWNPRYSTWPAGSCAYGESGCATGQGQSPEFVRSKWSLLHIMDSINITIEGPGGLTAPGRDFWRVRNFRPEVCGYCLLKLERSRHLQVADLALTDSPMYQVVIMHSEHVDLLRLSIVVNDESVGDGAPHNTDGVSIISSQDVRLRDSEVESGDDNIVIKEGSKRIHVESVRLFRGKGVSIGSLGELAAEAQVVTDVVFRNVSLDWSMHGARIKTWVGGQGLVRNVTFEQFKLDNVAYGILIDQNYCPLSQRPEGCDNSDYAPAVSIEDVKFVDFSGTYRKEDIKVSCTKCSRVMKDRVRLRRAPGAWPDSGRYRR